MTARYRVWIYALCDPRDKTIRYIGQTACVKERFTSHSHLNSSGNMGLMLWKKELFNLGLSPIMKRICCITTNNMLLITRASSAAEKSEIRWHSYYNRQNGLPPLLNLMHVPKAKPTPMLNLMHVPKAKPTPKITFENRVQSCSEWARELGISRQALHQRLKVVPVEIAVTVLKGCSLGPPRHKRGRPRGGNGR